MMFDEELSARRFTDAARRVVRHVAERALDRGMYSGEFTPATAEMLAVLSMLRWERKVAKAALEELVDCDVFARELDHAIDEEGTEKRRPNGPILETLPSGQKALVADMETPLQRILDHAQHEARALGHDWIGTEHLLLAAISSACPRFEVLLRRHAISYDRIRHTILELLGS